MYFNWIVDSRGHIKGGVNADVFTGFWEPFLSANEGHFQAQAHARKGILMHTVHLWGRYEGRWCCGSFYPPSTLDGILIQNH